MGIRDAETSHDDQRWGHRLPAPAEYFLRALNPWWQAQPMRPDQKSG